MKPFISFCSLLCVLFISQITFAQPATFYDYAWSRDGSRLVVMVRNESTVIATVYDAQWQPLASRQIPCCGVSLSPDGNLLMVNSAPAEIWDTDTLQTVRVLPDVVGLAAWSPNGTELATGTTDLPGGLMIYNAADGRLLREFTTSTASAWGWAYPPVRSPNGIYYVAGLSNQLVLLDALTGQQIGANHQLDGDIEAFRWSSDSTRLVISLRKLVPEGTAGSFPRGDGVGSYDLRSIVVFEISSGTTSTLRSGFRYPALLLMWSPDDRYIATGLDGILYTMDAVSGNLIESFNLPPYFTVIDWSPFGGRLLTGLESNSTFDASPNNEIASLAVSRSTFVETELGGLIQVLVPLASPERLQAISDACGLAPAADTALTAELSTQDYAGFTTQLEALPESALPPGCRADLLAVAAALEALDAQGR
jgi:WD40 repeat protein